MYSPSCSATHKFRSTTFYQEWDAGFLGLRAVPLLMTRRYWRQGEIPRFIILLPLGFLALVWLQYAIGRIEYLAQALLFTFYLLWAALLVMLGQRLREELGLPQVALWLAVFLLAGAELAALAGFIQKYALHNYVFNRWVDVKAGGPVFANLGQPNHLADYLVLGLAALGLLQMRLRAHLTITLLLAAPLVFVLVLTASRSAGVYLVIMLALAYLWRTGDDPAQNGERRDADADRRLHRDHGRGCCSSSWELALSWQRVRWPGISSRSCRSQRGKPAEEWPTPSWAARTSSASAALIGIPIGFIAGIYLSEYEDKKFASIVRYVADLLNGVPSIIVGILAWALVCFHSTISPVSPVRWRSA